MAGGVRVDSAETRSQSRELLRGRPSTQKGSAEDMTLEFSLNSGVFFFRNGPVPEGGDSTTVEFWGHESI